MKPAELAVRPRHTRGACRGVYLCTILMTDRSVTRLWLMSSSLSVHEELSVRYWIPASLTLKRGVTLPQEGAQKAPAAATRDADLVQSEMFRCRRYFRVAKDLKLASVNLGHSAAWSQRRPCELLHRACQLASVSWLLPEAGVNGRETLIVLPGI